MNWLRRILLLAGALALVSCGIAAPGTSSRGTSWSRHEGMTGSPHVIGIGSGLVVGFAGDQGGLKALRSTDGLSWTAVEVIDPLDKASVGDIAARTGEGGNAFVAVGSWTVEGQVGRAAAWVSDGSGGWKRAPDGPDLANSSGTGGTGMSAVVWGQERWVAGGVEWGEGANQDGVIWTSPDGFNWSRVTLPDPGMGITDLVAGGPGFVAVGSSESVATDAMPGGHSGIWTSVDGTTWARVPDGPIFANANINAVVKGGPGLVAVGYTIDRTGVFGPAVWTSVDGLAWRKEASPTDPNPWTPVEGTLQGRVMFGIVAVPEGFVAVGVEFGLNPRNLHRAAVWTSADGRTWARVPHDSTFDGGEDSSARFGMRAVYLIGDRLIASGVTPSGPTLWVSPPEPGKLPGQADPVPTAVATPAPQAGPTQPVSPAPEPAPTMPFEMGAAEFLAQVCPTLAELELALGNDAGERGPDADALFDALEARDPEGIRVAVGPVRNHLESAAGIINGWTPWPPGQETGSLLGPFVRHLLANLDDIERDAKAGIAPAAGMAAFVDDESRTQFLRILDAAGEALRQAPPESSAC